MSREELREKCEDAAELLVPYFSEEYDIDLEVPDFTVLSHDEFKSPGRMHYVQENNKSNHSGEVIVLYDEIWPETIVNKSVAHELGHVAEDINSKERIKSVEYPKGKYVPCFEEGIANHFERKGLEYLEKKFKEEDKFKSKCHKACRLYEGISLKTNEIFPFGDKYSLGDKIFSSKDKEDIKQAIEMPEKFFKSIDFTSL